MKKKLFFSLLLASSSSIGFAQLLDVASTQKVDLPQGTAAEKVTLSPSGDYLLVSDFQKQGLQKFDFATGSLTTVTTAAGSEYNPLISADGNTIVYRQTQVGSDHLKLTSLQAVNLSTNETATLVEATRDLQGAAIGANAVSTVSKRQMKATALNGSASSESAAAVAYIEKGQLMIAQNGTVTAISPNGTIGQSYLWPSISPDGKKVVYYLATKGAYTCDLDGGNPTYIGVIRAPKWYGNDIVVGMRDTDNGEYVTASEIIAVAADGSASQTLTGSDVVAMYPSVSQAAGKIAFTTAKGEAYIINVSTNE